MFKSIFKLFVKKENIYSKTDQLRYLSQSALIEETIAPHVISTTLMSISVIIISLIAWAGFTKVDEIAITKGEVIPSKHVQLLQHLEGGMVSEIKVLEGQLVEKDQVLLVLDGNSAKQDLASLKAKKLSLDYQSLGLRAFINKTQPDFSIIGKNENKELIQEQVKAFESMLQAKESDKDIIENQIKQKIESLNILEKRKLTLTENLQLIEKEMNLKKQLTDKGHLSKFKYLEIQKKFNDSKSDLDQNYSELFQAKNSIAEYKNRLESLEANYIDDAYKELDNVETNLSQVSEAIQKVYTQVKRLEIKSPAYGLVKELKINTIGAVIGSGQVIAEVVPLEGNLVIQAKIQPKDVGYLQQGQHVNVKISAYDFSRYGTINGTLEYISASTFAEEDGTKYYMGRIAIEQKHVGPDPTKNLIIPGMTVQADIVTGNKSILAYLLKPIHNSITTAFTER